MGGAGGRGQGAGKEERGKGKLEGEGCGGVGETREGKDGAEERFKETIVVRMARSICIYNYRQHWQSHKVGSTYRLKTRVSQVDYLW